MPDLRSPRKGRRRRSHRSRRENPRSPSGGSLLSLSVVVRRVFRWPLLAGDPIALGRPVAEIPELAPLRTERPPGVSVPRGRLAAHWAANGFWDGHHGAPSYRLRAFPKRVGRLPKLEVRDAPLTAESGWW